MRFFEDVYFSDEEFKIFAEGVRWVKNSSLRQYKVPDLCIADALCRVATDRRWQKCGTYVNSVKKSLTRVVAYQFSEDEKERIIKYCMDDTGAKNLISAEKYLGTELVQKLAAYVPELLRTSRSLADMLDDVD